MKRGKKVLSTILALVLLCCLTLPALPAMAYDNDFVIKDGEVRGYYGDSKDVTIPDGVTRIRGDAFLDCNSMTSVTIPDSVTSIERGMFRHCESLTRIEVGEGNSVYSSQEGVLFNKEKTELLACPPWKAGHYTIPSSVASIGKYAFNGCKSLTGVTIPDSVTTIGEYAFSGCDATSVTIPDSVTIIRECAFSGSGLTSVTIPNSVLYIERDAFRDCERLTSVTISASLRFMGENVFNGCDNLYSVVFEKGAATIGTFAFYACKNLTYVQLPNTVTRIGNMPFSSCPWFDSGEGDWLILSGHLLRYRGTDSVVTVPEGSL